MSVKKHTAYNLVGSAIPLALALVTVPLYLKLVGPDRYGVLAIAWLLLGYFGLFDLGLGRATSFRIAALRAATDAERARTFWSALVANAAMGCVGGAGLWIAAHYFYGQVLKVDEHLRPEILAGVPYLAASVPIATITGVLTGALQGRERFLETNLISTSSTILFHVLPLGVAALFGPNLASVLLAAISARGLAVAVMAWRCLDEFGRRGVGASRAEIVSLLKYGGWVNLTSIFGPLLVFVDRFAIGSILGAPQVGIYSVPFQLTRLVAIMPSSFTNALFPKMSGITAEEQDAMTTASTRAMAFLITPIVLTAIFGIGLFLHLWVGEAIAAQATPIGRILLIGFWANAFALVPFTQLQAAGRPDLVTKMLLLQIPFYLAALYLGITRFGLIGSAVVFSARCIVDYLLLSAAAKRPWREPAVLAGNGLALVVAAAVCAHWGITAWQWWTAATLLLAAVLACNWQSFPQSEKLRFSGLLQRTLNKA